MDNVPSCFFADTYPQEIASTEANISYNHSPLRHFLFPNATVFLPKTALIHRQNASRAISADSLFLQLYVILLPESEGSDMQKDSNRNPAAIYEDLVAALKAQVEKQEQIIRTQDETIRLLQEHNEELAAFLNYYTQH